MHLFHAGFLLALFFPSCINGSPLTPPAISDAFVLPDSSSTNASHTFSSEVSAPRYPADPFTFDNDKGWAVKYTNWEEPGYPKDLVDDLLSGALTRLDRERGSQEWDRRRRRRSFFFKDPAIGICFELQRVSSPEKPLTYEGVRVAIQGAQHLAYYFGPMVTTFDFYLRYDHIGGPLVATGFFGELDYAVSRNGTHLSLRSVKVPDPYINISRSFH